jgi:predicted PurR-regulated permease PerM
LKTVQGTNTKALEYPLVNYLKEIALEDIIKLVTILSNIFTIIASSIAIYIFITKRETISTVFNLLINYTFQLSLSEIKEKLEKLNEYNAKNAEDNEKVINILNEIVGQIKGNDKLRKHFQELLSEVDVFASGRKKLNEFKKRALVSELRERLRHLNVRNIDKLVGEGI